MQNSLFLATYKKWRKSLLEKVAWNAVAKLGPKAFQTPMWDFGVALVVLTYERPSVDSSLVGCDLGDATSPEEKEAQLPTKSLAVVSQAGQLKNPDAAIIFEAPTHLEPLSKYAVSYQGASTVEIERFRKYFWEVRVDSDWNLHQSTPSGGSLYSGLEFASMHRRPGGDFDKAAEALKGEGRLGGAYSGQPVWGKTGIACSWMGTLPTAIYLGAVFDNSIAAIVPHDPNHLLAIWCYCSSPDFLKEVRKINQKTQVANATLVKVPFDLVHWHKVASEMYPNGLPLPHSDDPTQWLFGGHPKGSEQPLQVAVARLVGYEWPRQSGSTSTKCQGTGVDGLESHVDVDGIVCLPSIKGEPAAANRLNGVLAAAFGSEWSVGKLDSLLAAVGFVGKSLDDWLRGGFFTNHLELFHHAPFIWHVWDGRQDGFHALVNYHRLAAPNGEGRRVLEKLIYSYLGDWIARQRNEQSSGIDGADARLAAAEHLKTELEKILGGEPPYDVFVRWKPLHQLPIGWEPNINDGVRINIRPFVTARPQNARKRACILRVTPRVDWEKDRGKEPQRPKDEYPWFWSWDEQTQDFAGGSRFDGNRWNDLHYSVAAKQAARERAAAEAQPEEQEA
jgi:hypothetical protein